MAFTHLDKTAGHVEMIQGEQQAFTRAWVQLDTRPFLKPDERDLVNVFGVLWFDGRNFKYDDQTLLDFIKLTKTYGIAISWMSRATKTVPAGRKHFVMPEPSWKEWGSYWPKDRKDFNVVPDLVKTHQEARSWLRNKFLEEARAELPPERIAIGEHAREIDRLKKLDEWKTKQIEGQNRKIAELDNLVIELAELVEGLKQDRSPAPSA